MEKVASDIYYYSAGHPRLVQSMLLELPLSYVDVDQYFIENKQKIIDCLKNMCGTIQSELTDSICGAECEKGIPKKLLSFSFKQLSVCRIIDSDFLKSSQKTYDITDWELDLIDFVQRFQYYETIENVKSIYYDGVYRRLFSYNYLIEDHQSFTASCKMIKEYCYDKLLENGEETVAYNKWVAEYIFQCLQSHMHFMIDRDIDEQTFALVISEINDFSSSFDFFKAPEFNREIRNTIVKDSDINFLSNYLFGHVSRDRLPFECILHSFG
jgi:hypothetical protein